MCIRDRDWPAANSENETASQISPCTNTFPRGESAVCATPVSPINPCAPVTTLFRLALSAIDIRNAVITPSGMLTASAVRRWTRISGIGESTRSNPPSVSNAMPPTVSTPWLANLASAANNAKAARIRLSAAKRVGSKFKAKAAIRMKTTPTVPGTTAPGSVSYTHLDVYKRQSQSGLGTTKPR